MRQILERIRHEIDPRADLMLNNKRISEADLIPFESNKSLKQLAFIDGGNATVFGSPGINASFIRIYYTIYHKNKRIKSGKSEFFCVVKAIGNVFTTQIHLTKKGFFDKEDLKERLEFKIPRTDEKTPESIIDIVRRLAEIRACHLIIRELSSGDTIILDGSIRTKEAIETEAILEAIDKATRSDILLGALAKTCSLLADDGRSIVSVIRPLKEGRWFMPIEDDTVDAYLVKLNRSARHVMRFEISKKQSRIIQIDRVLGFLAINSLDPVFLGYPYGLIDADSFARVRNEERDYLRVLLGFEHGAHHILDNIR